jgi:hypothetical protein
MPSTSTHDLDLAKSDHERNDFSRHYDKLDIRNLIPSSGLRSIATGSPIFVLR